MSERFLLLDHDPTERARLIEAFAGDGYDLVAPVSASEAHERLWEHYDLALIDLDWPDINAAEWAGNLRALHQGVMIVVSSCAEPDLLIGRSRALNAASFCLRPIDAGMLRWEIERCFEIRRLRQAQEAVIQLSHAVNSAYDGIVLADLNGRITYTNHAVRELFGYGPDELIGKGVEVLNPAYIENREMIAAMLSREGWSGEIMTIRKDGSWFPILLSTSLVRDEAGMAVALMGIVKDLSAVKEAEAEIARRNLELSALNQVSDTISQSLDFDEVVGVALERVIEATGLEMGAVHLLDDDRRELVMAACNRLPEEYTRIVRRVKINEDVLGHVFESGHPIYTDDARQDNRLGNIASLKLDVAALVMVPLRARDRVIGTMSVGARGAHRLDEHEIGLIVTMGQQIGLAVEKARLFQQLSRDKREWEDTFDAITDLISVQNRDGRIVRVNRALVDRLGRPKEQLIGRLWHEALFRTGPGMEWKRRVSGDGVMDPVIEESHDLVVEGAFTVSVFPRYGEMGDRIGSVSVIRDITEHRRLEEQIQRLDRLSSLGELSAGIAHEIRNPLSSVKLDTQLLGRYMAQDPRGLKIVANILDAIEKIERVVRNTLSYARPEEPEFQMVDVHAVIDQSLSVVQTELKTAGITGRMEPGDAVPAVYIDPNQIQQVFVNLFLNAIQAMPSGGRLTVRTLCDEHCVRVIIQDTGIGITPDNLKKIFNPFYTTRSQGTGLGLSIVQRILERHHASIEVDSPAPTGATFTVQLPLRIVPSSPFRPRGYLTV